MFFYFSIPVIVAAGFKDSQYGSCAINGDLLDSLRQDEENKSLGAGLPTR